jgi:predicted alpha/beta-hydrolase family hydrolase
VALREALTDERVGALALIGLPLEPADIEIPPTPRPLELRSFASPTLLVAGEGDVFCPRPPLEALGAAMSKAEVVVVPGTDHYLWRREQEVAETVGSFAERVLLEGSDAD